jgi:hypothetical protein
MSIKELVYLIHGDDFVLYFPWFKDENSIPSLNLKLPNAFQVPQWTEINIINKQDPWEIKINKLSLWIDLYFIWDLKTETYYILVDLIWYTQETNTIHWKDFFEIVIKRINEMEVILTYPNKKSEQIRLDLLNFSLKLYIFSSFSEIQINDIRQSFEKVNSSVKLRFSDYNDLLEKAKLAKWKISIPLLKGSIENLKQTLINSPDWVEEVYHQLIKWDPRIIDIYAKNVHSKPQWFNLIRDNIQGYNSFIPDFIFEWYNWNYLLVEIEKPSKELMRKDWNQTVLFTQAYSQLSIRNWALNRGNVKTAILKKFPWINDPSKRKFLLILWRDSHFQSIHHKEEFISNVWNLNPSFEVITYDDLIKKCEQVIENLQK